MADFDSRPGHHLLPGQLIGRYRLLSLVASGGMAQIWAAKPESGGFSRTVALKVVRPEYSEDEEYRRMLIDEAAAAAAVHHPNVCEIFELGQHESTIFIAMEWVAGDSIAGLIRQRTQYVPFSYALAARVIADACAGLHAAHLACAADGEPMNIVHRDISPQNILLSMQGHVKVTDFGIAKARDQLHSRTRTGEIKGKFAYISPEQILGQKVDHRSDVYAMGCVLFVATLGLRPFGRGNHAVMSKIVKGEFKAPRELVPTYPEDLEKIVVKALGRTPDIRYQSAEEMRLALEDWLAKSGKIVTHTDISRAVSERLNPKVRSQIQTLRNANKFTPRDIAPRVGEDDEADSWEMPTAVSGLIHVPDGVFDGAAAVAATHSRAESSGKRPSTRRPPEHVPGRDRPTNPATPSSRSFDDDSRTMGSGELRGDVRAKATRAVVHTENSATVKAIEDINPNSAKRAELKKNLWLTLIVTLLVVLAFLAGRM